MKHYAATKNNEVLIHITTWVKLGDNIAGKQKKKPVTKTIYGMIPLIWSMHNGQVLETGSTWLVAKGQGKREIGSGHEFDM